MENTATETLQKTTAEAESYAEHRALRAPKPEPAADDKKPSTLSGEEKKSSGEEKKPEVPSEPPKKAGESAEVPETSKQETQEPPKSDKRDRSAQGRAKELIAEGRFDEAAKILEAAGAKREKERADRLEQELQEHRTRKPAETAPATPKAEAPKAAADDPEPKVDEYDGSKGKTYDDYLRAVARWEGRQAFRQEQQATAQKQQQDTVRESMTKKVTAAKAKYEDFEAVTAGDPKAGSGLILSPAMQQFVVESDSGLDVAYHLGKNPDEYARIFMLTPARQIAELGKIEASLAIAPAAPPEKPKQAPPVSKAPPPPATVGGTETPAPKSTSEASSMEEHRRLRRAQMSGR